jgi:hypothetical protein
MLTKVSAPNGVLYKALGASQFLSMVSANVCAPVNAGVL